MLAQASSSAGFEARCAAGVCRACGRRGLAPILDLGSMPLSDGFLDAAALAAPEPRYPLEVAFCPGCALVQILETVAPDVLFGDDYPYYSSVSDTWCAHARSHALNLIEQRGLTGQSLVVEIASNDGYLLRNFVERGIRVLGIDPVPGPARAAREAGVETMEAFFGRDLARRLADQGTRADVLVANNVLAHVADTTGFVEGLGIILAEDGLATLEFPYVRDLIDQVQFDTIYHEHLCYFSLTAVDRLFRACGLYVNAVERLPLHGGSLRLYVQKQEAVEASVTALLEEEQRLGVDDHAYYLDFADRVGARCAALRERLEKIKMRGGRIAAYGAAAKGTILLNAIGADADLIEFAVDRNVHKHGKWIPGVRIPILPVEELAARQPGYTLILPWNVRAEIIEQQQAYRDAGGRFIVPIPELQVL